MAQVPFKSSQQVEWKWLGRPILGMGLEVHFSSITKLIKGKKITRHGSPAKPAYVVESEAGNFALKLHSDLQSIASSKASKSSKKAAAKFRKNVWLIRVEDRA